MITTIAFLILCAPPQIEITTKQTKITQGQTIVTVLPDGSVSIKSPAVNLTIPAANEQPVEPSNDDLSDALKAIYGADQDNGKKNKLAALIKSYESALDSIEKAAIVADLAESLQKYQTLKPADLRSMRDRIAQEIQLKMGTDPDVKIDATAAKSLLQKIITILKGLQNA